MMIDRKF